MKAVKEQISRAEISGDVIPAFFKSIAGPHPVVPETISGSLRFDLKNGNRSEGWRVAFDKGVVSSSHSNDPADCIVHTDKETLEAIILGKINGMVALLRGALTVEGKSLFLALFRSLLTEPAAEHGPQP